MSNTVFLRLPLTAHFFPENRQSKDGLFAQHKQQNVDVDGK